MVLALDVLAALAPAVGVCPLDEAPSPRFATTTAPAVRVEVARAEPRSVAVQQPVVRAPRFGAAIYAVRLQVPVQVIELRLIVQ